MQGKIFRAINLLYIHVWSYVHQLDGSDKKKQRYFVQ